MLRSLTIVVYNEKKNGFLSILFCRRGSQVSTRDNRTKNNIKSPQNNSNDFDAHGREANNLIVLCLGFDENENLVQHFHDLTFDYGPFLEL